MRSDFFPLYFERPRSGVDPLKFVSLSMRLLARATLTFLVPNDSALKTFDGHFEI
jgi:hypothetical protein